MKKLDLISWLKGYMSALKSADTISISQLEVLSTNLTELVEALEAHEWTEKQDELIYSKREEKTEDTDNNDLPF